MPQVACAKPVEPRPSVLLTHPVMASTSVEGNSLSSSTRYGASDCESLAISVVYSPISTQKPFDFFAKNMQVREDGGSVCLGFKIGLGGSVELRSKPSKTYLQDMLDMGHLPT